MGRPLRKDKNGTDVIGTPVSNAGITVRFYDGSTLQSDGIIIKQRGAKTYVVARVGTPTTKFTCTVVSGTPSAQGEMSIQGSTTGQLDANLVSIAKLTKRVATDFSGGRYTWYLESDSSADYIVLTAL
jgi:ribosomal protein L27